MKNAGGFSGMLYILISFIPWMVYWVLCGFGLGIGILISLATTIILIIPQIRSMEFNPMDLASLLYFASASVATYLIGLELFIERAESLGYLTLFLMASISIAVGHPFTLQASKRDYPEIYWRDRSFIMINSVISGVWAAIFLSNSIIPLVLDKPYKIIASNVLIVAGVIFSILIPERLSAYLHTRKFRKYDWRVEVDRGRSRAEDEYDVIIVGSGIGGLTCGALLSKRGYRILVLEQHYQVGGYCSSFTRAGFTFNVGVSDVSGLWEKGPVALFLRGLGLKPEDLFIRNRLRYVFRGEGIEAEDLDGFVEVLSELFPAERGSVRRFFDDAAIAYEECYREVEAYGVPLPAELIVKVFGPKKLLNYPWEHPHFYDWMNKTFSEKLDEYFEDGGLKRLLCALMGYVGVRPEEMPASSALTAIISYYLHGGYFPRGGAQSYAETLRKFIENHDGVVLLRHRVDEILVEGWG